MSNNKIRDLLDELDMESWLDYEGIQYKRTRGKSGIQLNVRECPCCGNTKWKVYLNANSGLGNCFVCEEKLNKWKFIASHMNTSGSDTFSYVEKYMVSQGWKPRQVTSAPVDMATELNAPTSIPIPIKGRNLQYLENRNISIELAQFFRLSYCAKGFFKYTDADGKPAVQNYSGRVIIPVFDLDGKLVTFQGRDITGTAARKYLFPPGFASTGSIIYNGHNAFKAPRVVVGEGAFDAFAIKAAMDEDRTLRDYCAVATFGKALGPDQLQKLKRLKEEGALKEVIFMWDSERLAIHAAVDAALLCKGAGIPARIAMLPKDRDPNEVAPEVVRRAIWDSTQVTAISAIRLKLMADKLA